MSRITSLTSHPILNSRGDWTIRVIATSAGGHVGIADVPEGESKGSSAASYVEPEAAARNVMGIIAPELTEINIENQAQLDKRLVELDGTTNKEKLGANALLGVSLAAAKASALEQDIPLWKHIQHLSGISASKFPRLYMNFIEGGAHAGSGLAFQEYLVIPKTERVEEAVRIGSQLYHELREYLRKNVSPASSNIGDEGGFALELTNNLAPFDIINKVARQVHLREHIDFGMDAAANNVELDAAELHNIYHQMKSDFDLFYLEDPFGEEDFENFRKLHEEMGDSIVVAGDDLTTTNLDRMRQAHENKSINGMIIKPNQIGTLTESLDAVWLAREWGWSIVASHRGKETNDDFIADFAYGVGADGIKLGGVARGERIAKYNRLLAIAKEQYYV